MRNLTLVLATFIALSAGGRPLAGDSCVMLSGDHACCSRAHRQAVEHCCAATTDTESANDAGCHCAHPPELTAVATCQLPDADHRASVLASPAILEPPARSPRGPTAHQASLRSHSPPPTYLLDCAFLT
jgi:hypothetical protein